MDDDDPRLLALLARLEDVQALTTVLFADVADSLTAVDPQRPSSRRAYVRAVFALVEGAQSGMSTYLLQGHDSSRWALSDAEKRVLWDAVPAIPKSISSRSRQFLRLIRSRNPASSGLARTVESWGHRD
jgi:hypothetical protein